MTDLVVFKELPSPVEVYTSGAAKPFIEKVKEEARAAAAELDISTPQGREAIASLAYKVARTKTTLDNSGKELTEEWKQKSAAVDRERKYIRDELDALKEEIRAPLTAYEEAEKARIAEAEFQISNLESAANIPDDYTAAEIEQRLNSLKETAVGYDWREFYDRAKRAKDKSIQNLETKLAARRKYEADQAELARLRKEQEERDAAEAARLEQERLDKIAADAAEKARREAEEKAEADRQRLEKEKQDAIDAAAKAEADAKAAQEKHDREMAEAREQAKKDAAAAVERDRQRQEAEAKAKADEDARRAADKAHKARIHGEALNAIKNVVDNCKTTDPYKEVVIAIAKGLIPHVKISY